jgi:hypothetical protein
MAKMFYTLNEVCEKLGKSETEVEAMVASGQIQEFRDGEHLVFKVEQIELLSPNEDSGELELDLDSSSLDLDDSFGVGESATGEIGLAGSQSADIPSPSTPTASGLGIEDSGSALGLGSSSMLSAGGDLASNDLDLSAELDSPADSADASASAFDGAAIETGSDTQLGEGLDDDLTLESVGSGSGLLDLTRESDDTSLGAELLEEVYASDDDVDFPAASGLFEAATDEDDAPAAAPMAAIGGQSAPVSAAPAMAAAQSWDPTWSGLTAGLMIGGLVALVAVFAMVAVETMGGASGIASLVAEQMWMWVGGLAAGTLVLGVIGWVVGGKSG